MHGNFGAIILAAGESRRMGRAKQLLPFAGTTLLRRACQTALAAGAKSVVVVLGAESEACAAEIAELAVQCAVNPDWADGMGGSLRVGLTRLPPECIGALVLLPDQPLIGVAEVERLLAAWDRPRVLIAAARYDGALGAPAIFAREVFPELAALSGPQGARAIIARHASETAPVDMPAAARDVDTPEDYARLKASPL